jgi:YVTN family beta-propeller protein
MAFAVESRIGTELHGYRLDALLRRGGMGVVYRAHDPRLKRNVALKLLAPELAEDRAFRERFLRESEVAAALEHPNVVPIHDVGEIEGQLFIVMRLVEGADLGALLRKEGMLEPRRALALVAQVAAALDAAHERGLVHRDVKPSNVLVDPRDHAYLADFGLTRRLSDPSVLLEHGLSFGTPAYVAPEQIRGGEVDGLADQYALACLLYECLNGETPFPRSSEAAVLFAHLEEAPPRSPPLETVLPRALAKDPADRYASCRELLDAAGDALGVPVRPGDASSELPRGTVTLLFTDIEGSTKLLKQLGERYGGVLADQKRILRDAAAARGGREVDNQGDSFFFVFGRANAALGAAVDAQRRLAEHAWPEETEVRVRMGLHTGEPVVGDERYVGLGVHRAARIGAVAHGGQVLLSGATRELVEDEVDGVAVRELGSYRLKDIDRPERLFQLDIDGLRSEFPPLKAEQVAEPRPVRRRAILLSALAGVIAAAVAIPIFAFGQNGGGTSIDAAAANSVGFVDAKSNRLVADVSVGLVPADVVAGEGALWVANVSDGTVDRIDPATRTVRQTIPVGSGPSAITAGNGAIWVANSLSGTVSRIDPVTNTVRQTIPVGNGPGGIAYAAGSIWVANTGDGTITLIDADSGKPRKTVPVTASSLAVGAGSLWASSRTAGRVTRVDPKSHAVLATIPVGHGAAGVAFGSGAVWVANSLDGTVSRIDPVTNSVAATVPTGNGPTAVAADRQGVWVANQFDGSLARIDPRTNAVVRRVDLGNRPQDVAIAGGNVLVSVRQSSAGHRGGTLRVRSERYPDSIDPAVAYDSTSWPFLHLIGDGLVAFNQAGGLAGTQLVPDLSVSLPTPTDGGRTYSFRLRPGIRFSDGRLLKASDVRATFERDFEVGKLPVAYYDGIVGASRCKASPRRCDLTRGVVPNDVAGTVTFHLVSPDPEFPYKLALPFALVVPGDTPRRDLEVRSVAGTGPYMVATYRPRHVLRLVRNPHFHEWSKAAQPDGYPDEIVFESGGSADGALRDVIQGRADVVSTINNGVFSPAQMMAIETRIPGQVHTNPFTRTIALFLNTRLPPFDRLGVRKALNYAVDRAEAVRLVGGDEVAQTTCQILPPFFPGYRPYCPYTADPTAGGAWKKPDLRKARALVAASGTRGMRVTVWSFGPLRDYGPFAARLLRSLGYRASVKLIDDSSYFAKAWDSRSKAQIGLFPWSSDYPAASGFFEPVLSCASFVPNSSGNSNAAEFCDPHIDRRIDQALAKQAIDPEGARGLWEAVDRQTVDQAPWVPLVSPKVVDVVSKRVGNYQYSVSGTGMLLDQLWVR